jgi:F0F1-type ATP synthase membrane subunit b/b'
MMKTLSLISMLLVSAVALASEHGAEAAAGHGHGGIPKVVMYQAINFAILCAILYWAGRKKVPAFFTGRYETFMKQATEAARIKKDLEDKKADLEKRMETLRRTSAQSLEDAKKDADKLYAQELEKARSNATQIGKDAANVLSIDAQKLTEKLRLEALAMSVAAAEEQLKTTAPAEKTKLNTQFQQRVEGARV